MNVKILKPHVDTCKEMTKDRSGRNEEEQRQFEEEVTRMIEEGQGGVSQVYKRIVQRAKERSKQGKTHIYTPRREEVRERIEATKV